jgi:hypothetical protein
MKRLYFCFLIIILILILNSCDNALQLNATLEVDNSSHNIISNGGVWIHTSNGMEYIFLKNNGNVNLVIKANFSPTNGTSPVITGSSYLVPNEKNTWNIYFSTGQTGKLVLSTNDKNTPDYVIYY